MILLIYTTNPALNRPRDYPFESLTFNPEVEIILTGDVMLGRAVMTKSLGLEDPTYPFRKVADELSKADIVFVNLENPLISNCPKVTTGLKFCADPKMAEGLVLAGVDVVSLANNHSKDYGTQGLNQTLTILRKRGISATGLENLVVKEVKGVSFGFLGFDFLSQKPTEGNFNLVSRSKEQADVLIVGVHWGKEYTSKPLDLQKEWARRLVERGADVVVGHGPHWVQGDEKIDGKPVYYSLGNFIFDQMWSEKTRQGLVMKLTFRGKDLIREEKLPVYMSSWAQPEFKFGGLTGNIWHTILKSGRR